MKLSEAYQRLCSVAKANLNIEDERVTLNPPATASAIAGAKEQLGMSLPQSLLAFYALGNGQPSPYDSKSGPYGFGMLAGTQLLSLDHMFAARESLAEAAACAEEEPSHRNQFVEQTFWLDEWIPVGAAFEFGSVALMDTNPTAEGVAEQIFFITEPYVVSGIVAVGMQDFIERCTMCIGKTDIFQWSDLPAIDPNTGALIAESCYL
jgi:cell wall assembly regulator SMI1